MRPRLHSSWRDRVSKLGLLCPHRKSATVIAVLGTALLAKSTDVKVDVFSLLDRGKAPGAYSARSLADNVWARCRAELEIDLGANGPNPLNNTPFIGKRRIDEISGVRNRDGWDFFLECMDAVKGLKSAAKAAEALRGFIAARRKSLMPPSVVEPELGDNLTQAELLTAIGSFVSKASEGGRRAQAVAAALLDATYGIERIIVGGINDPDRHAPLDVSVKNGESIEDGFAIAIEIKDKPISEYHVRSSIEKSLRDHGTRNLAFVAISKRQTDTDFGKVVLWAGRLGIKVSVFLDWCTFFSACKCFAPTDDHLFEGKVFRQILHRGAELGVARDALDELRKASVEPQEG